MKYEKGSYQRRKLIYDKQIMWQRVNFRQFYVEGFEAYYCRKVSD